MLRYKRMRFNPILVRCLILNRYSTHLLDNARFYKYLGDVSIEDRAKCLFIRVSKKGKRLDDAEMEKVYIPFYHVDGLRNRTTNDTGLGLSIVRNIAFTWCRGFVG